MDGVGCGRGVAVHDSCTPQLDTGGGRLPELIPRQKRYIGTPPKPRPTCHGPDATEAPRPDPSRLGPRAQNWIGQESETPTPQDASIPC